MEKASDNTSTKKKTMGRRKIEMKKIENRSSLQVAFSKRRAGLFKKASELSVLCGCEIAILVQSPAEKMYSFGHPSADSTIRRFLTNGNNSSGGEKGCYYDSSSRLGYAEALKKIQLENNNNTNNQEKDGGLWFDRSIEGMGIDDLEEYLEGLQGLLGNVQNRLTEVNKNNNDIVKGILKNDNVWRAVMVDPQSSNGLDGDDDDLKKLSDEIFEGMSDDEDSYAAVMMVNPPTDAAHCSTSSSSSSLEGLVGYAHNDINKNNNSNIVEAMGSDDVNSSVMMDPGSNCASSSSSLSMKGLVMVGDNHEREKSSSISSTIHNQYYNSHGGSSSSSSLSMGQNDDSFDRMRYDEIYAALKMEIRAPPCSTSSSSSDIGGSSSSSASVMARHDGHDPLPLPQDDESIEDFVNWCNENVDFDACEFEQ